MSLIVSDTGPVLHLSEAHAVVLWAGAAGHLNRTETEAILERLAQTSLWISPRVVAEAKAALDQLF